jgi:hypothetical protein
MNSTLKFVIVLVVLIVIINMVDGGNEHFRSRRDDESLQDRDRDRERENRENVQNMYRLDPSGSVSQYDVSNMPISINCCPPQWMDDPELKDKNCDYSDKYVANNYSGMNYEDGLGCVCMTPNQATFYGHRGGNA